MNTAEWCLIPLLVALPGLAYLWAVGAWGLYLFVLAVSVACCLHLWMES